MRIGVNARLLVNNRMEGIPRYIFETTCQMATDHPEDIFILFFDRKVAGLPPVPSNVEFVIVPWHARHPVLWHLWLEYMLPFYFRRYDIDVFYSGDGYLSLRTSIPTVLVIHDLAYLHYPEHIPLPSLKHYRKWIPQYIQKASRLITVSTHVQRDLVAHFNLHSESIRVAGNALNENWPSRKGRVSDTIQQHIGENPFFLYVGAVQPRKNILGLIQAFRQFQSTSPAPYSLVIAGRMAWKTEEIKQAILHTPGVIYLGPVSEEDKFALIRQAAAVTYVSFLEGFGIPVLEAMACGTPVITSTVSSMPEVAGGAALLADPHHPSEIAQKMTWIANHPLLSSKLAAAGLLRIKAYSWKKSADTIYQSLKEALQ